MAWKVNIEGVEAGWHARVANAYQAVSQQLQQVQTQNLEGVDRAAPTDLTNQVNGTWTSYVQQKPQKLAQIQADNEKAKKTHQIFLAIQLALVLLGIILIASNVDGGTGAFLLIAALVVHFIFKSIDAKNQAKITDDWASFFRYFVNLFGAAETLRTPASGLYKEVDDLYLRSLDSQDRGFEMQRRQMQRQMDAQNEQHQEQLAVQKQQLARMDAMVIQNILFKN